MPGHDDGLSGDQEALVGRDLNGVAGLRFDEGLQEFILDFREGERFGRVGKIERQDALWSQVLSDRGKRTREVVIVEFGEDVQGRDGEGGR